MQLIVGTARVAVFASLEDKIVNMFLVITNTVTYLSQYLPWPETNTRKPTRKRKRVRVSNNEWWPVTKEHQDGRCYPPAPCSHLQILLLDYVLEGSHTFLYFLTSLLETSSFCNPHNHKVTHFPPLPLFPRSPSSSYFSSLSTPRP